jgi:uncharacterized protein (TIGR00297 family)
VIARTAVGFALACAISLVAWRARALSRSGALAAVFVGTAALAAGWSWGALLFAFFVTGTALSRVQRENKLRRSESVVAKGGTRDAVQVLANGGLFALAALASLVAPVITCMAIGGGALAAASADTWGTEVGTLSSRSPRLITTWRRVATGMSGGVTIVGLLASVAGGVFVGVMAWLVHWPPHVAVAAAAGGVAGALADSFAGALLQSRRQCARCGALTERAVHTCGDVTQRIGGIPWLDNDGVNLLAGLTGAAVALILAGHR